MLNQDDALGTLPVAQAAPQTSDPLHWAIAADTSTNDTHTASVDPMTEVSLPFARVAFNIAIGAIGIGILIALTAFSIVNDGILPRLLNDSGDFLKIALLVVGTLLAGFFVYVVTPDIYVPMGNVFCLAAAFIYDPVIVGWLMVAMSLTAGLFSLRLHPVRLFGSFGLNIVTALVASWLYGYVGGAPIVGDLTGMTLLKIFAGFAAFFVVNSGLWVLDDILGGATSGQRRRAGSMVAVAFFAMLPVAVLLAVLATQTGAITFGVAVGVTVVGAAFAQRAGQSEQRRRVQLDRVRDLNERLEQQNEYQVMLGARINATLDDFLTLVRDYAGTSHEQEASVIEITATVEQLSRTAGQIAASADQVAEAADMALTSADRGQNAVNAAIDAIGEVRMKVMEIAARISELDSKAARINDIISLINEIADEIRMLALNATIEASGAGPYGKRFGVVANEVNALADRSRRAVTEIGQIIGEIQQATVASVSATEEGLQRMERGMAMAAQTDDANRDIISVVEHTVQAAAAISMATQQQRSASEQVVINMHDVTRLIGQNTDKIARVSVASLDLQRVARDLRAENRG